MAAVLVGEGEPFMSAEMIGGKHFAAVLLALSAHLKHD